MAEQQQIAHELRRLFRTPQLWAHDERRLVFWYDPAGVFADVVAALDLTGSASDGADASDGSDVADGADRADGVEFEVYTLEQRPFFEKHYLLHEHPETHFLLYAPFARPEDEDNWLLDLELSGLAFSADRAAMIFRELGWYERALEDYVRQHLAFFADEHRFARLRDMRLPPDSDHAAVRLAMMSAALGLPTPDREKLLRRVLRGSLPPEYQAGNKTADADNVVPDFDGEANSPWQTLRDLFGEQELWQVVEDALSYRSDKPSLRQLYMQLAVTHAVRNLDADVPKHWQWALLERPAAAYVFVDNWLKHRDDAASWAVLSDYAGRELRLEDVTDALEPAAYVRVDTFEHFVETFIRAATLQLLAPTADYAHWRALLQWGKIGFWYDKYRHYYAALAAALDFLEHHQRLDLLAGWQASDQHDSQHDNQLDNQRDNQSEAQALFVRYSQDWYQLDGAYRRYVVASTAAGGDILKELDGLLERRYVREWLEPLARRWSNALSQSAEPATRSAPRAAAAVIPWQVAGVAVQWHFFERVIKPYLINHEREKVFVIISDALRYDVAADLRDRLVPDVRGEATLTPLLGVLPSRTNVGMAALLPGKRITIGEQVVSKDGLSSQGKDNRAKVFNNSGFDTVVFTAGELTDMSREEGRDASKAARLVVIYHDTIDKMGENDENKVFAACEDAIDELVKLVKRVCNSLNGINVYITADHGFVYQRQALATADKIEPLAKDTYLEVKRRHVLAREGVSAPQGSLGFRVPELRVAEPSAAGQDGAAEITVYAPQGMQRYALQGAGGQYVHGGASLQEITVPLLHYKHVRAKKGGQGASRKVNAQITASSRRVTNTLFTVRVLQLEAVDERLRPRTVSLGLYDQAGQAVTNVATLHLDKTSEQAPAREQTVRLTIGISNPDRGARYDLVMTDSSDGTEVLRETWSISLAFSDDFGEF